MKTLLDKFIHGKLKKYKEPKRIKVPRGQKIGITRVKYETALIVALCNFDLKGLTSHLNGSYEVIRRWKAENGFRDQCDEILKEFLWNIDVELEAIAARITEDYRKGICQFDPSNKLEIFNDSSTYSSLIIDHIEEVLRTYLCREDGHIIYFEMVKSLATFSGSPQLRALLILAEEGLRNSIIDRAIAVLSEPEISNQDREETILLLLKIRS